jgi:hypothetical protein
MPLLLLPVEILPQSTSVMLTLFLGKHVILAVIRALILIPVTIHHIVLMIVVVSEQAVDQIHVQLPRIVNGVGVIIVNI